MEKLIEKITKEMRAAFVMAGYDDKFGTVTLSNRPDLCEYQCNGALAAAKTYRKAPMMIAKDCAAVLAHNIEAGSSLFETVEAAAPGFLNLKLDGKYLAAYLEEMCREPKFGLAQAENPKKILIDYGGPNVAKPLHVGHLRPAIIGESVKRIARYMGHDVTGDVHLGDWGLQIGLVITELKHRQPD